MLFGGYGGYGFSGYGDYYEDFDHDPWSNRSEKSGAAERRESVVTNRFKSIRAIVKNTLEEKRKVRSAKMCITFYIRYMCLRSDLIAREWIFSWSE